MNKDQEKDNKACGECLETFFKAEEHNQVGVDSQWTWKDLVILPNLQSSLPKSATVSSQSSTFLIKNT